MSWYDLTRREILAIPVLIAVLGAALIIVSYPTNTRNWGFGPGWECNHPPDGDPICFKKPPAKPD